MAKGDSKIGNANAKAPSALEAYKENGRQLNEAKINARNAGAAVLEYKGIDGNKTTLYWSGGRWEEKPSAMAQRYSQTSGTYTADFVAPKEWAKRTGEIETVKKTTSQSAKANDIMTWKPGTKVQFNGGDDIYAVDNRGARTGAKWFDGTVKEIRGNHLIVDVPGISDHMWLDRDNAHLYRLNDGSRRKRK